MDVPFISGLAAFISAILIFCGSAFLLLMLVMGARLAYFVTASITLAFVLIMGVVWSVNPLGPVGQLPEWDPVGIGSDPSQIEFGAATAYPENPWRPPDEDDESEVTRVAELESAAQDEVTTAAQEGGVEGLPSVVTLAEIPDGATVLTEQDGKEYGATTVEVEGTEGTEDVTAEVLVVMQYDPGNPLGQARLITLGTLILFILHLVGLSLSEKRARREREPVTA